MLGQSQKIYPRNSSINTTCWRMNATDGSIIKLSVAAMGYHSQKNWLSTFSEQYWSIHTNMKQSQLQACGVTNGAPYNLCSQLMILYLNMLESKRLITWQVFLKPIMTYPRIGRVRNLQALTFIGTMQQNIVTELVAYP